jgi:hypothetical protein
VADSGAAITCQVTATNIAGSASAISNTITANVFTAPVNTVAPAITGTAQEGQTVTCSTGTWTGTPVINYAYQWKRNGSNIGSATNSTYTLVTADVGQSITCTVTATNGVGSANANSNTITPTAAVDPDAQAFITAAAITNPTQQAAINTLVVDLKGYSIWTKMKALYPFVTDKTVEADIKSQMKFNLKDPRDLDVAFRLTWNGGGSWGANGYTPNGINGYADTFFIPSASQTINSNGLGFYITANTFTSSDAVTMGAFNSSNQASILVSKINSSSVEILDGRLNAASSPQTIVGRAGSFDIQRTSATVTKLYKNASIISNFNSGGTVLPTLKMYIGNMSFSVNAPYSAGYTNSEFRLAYTSDGLTDTDITNLRTAVQAFQTTLGRSIGTQTVSDADAQAFVTNAGIVDQVEATAINNLVIGMKADGLWTKMKALYPFVGGTATSNSYNLKNTAQHQITWNGGVTFASNGITTNGTNGYGNTNLIPSSVLTLNNTHLSIYSRTTGTPNGGDIGFQTTGDAANLFIAGNLFGSFFADCYASTSRITAVPQTQGFYINTRTASNSYKVFRNTSQISSTITTSTGSLPASNLSIGALLTGGWYANKNYAFASIGDGLTDTEAANFYTAVQAFQTTLGRQV